MTAKLITLRGEKVWKLDARGQGLGRYFGPTKETVWQKYRDAANGHDRIEFDDRDRVAKQELGTRGTLLDAVRFYIGQKPPEAQQTLSLAAAECVAAKKKLNCRPAYTTHLEFILARFQLYIGKDLSCSHIATHHVQGFLDSKVWAGSTLVGMRNRLSAFFAFCLSRGYVTRNPVDAIKAPKVEKKVPRILTVAECENLLTTALKTDPEMLPYLVLGIFCGLRPEEIKRLPVKSVRLDESLVDLPAHVSKTRDRRLVELAPNAIAWLEAARSHFNNSATFVTYRSRRRALTAAAGVTWSADVMRHSFASYHLELHQSADKTALQLGHQGSTKMLFRHYKATVKKKEAVEFWALRPPPIVSVMSTEAA